MTNAAAFAARLSRKLGILNEVHRFAQRRGTRLTRAQVSHAADLIRDGAVDPGEVLATVMG